MLTDQDIEKFRGIYKTRFGKEITAEEADEKGSKLIRMVELIYQPMTEKEFQIVQERRKQTGDI